MENIYTCVRFYVTKTDVEYSQQKRLAQGVHEIQRNAKSVASMLLTKHKAKAVVDPTDRMSAKH